MSSQLILLIIVAYFGLLLLIAWITGRKSSSNDAFFLGNRKSPWYIVAIGMVGSSLSGGDVRVGTRLGTPDRYDVYADGLRLLFWLCVDCKCAASSLL